MQNKVSDLRASAEDESKASEPNFTLAKKRLASNPGTSPETLDKLAGKATPELAERVAENQQTPADTLEKLSNHECSEVRKAVSENNNTPEQILHELANDVDPDVRYRLAENAATPTVILETLTEDENPFVVARAQDTLKASRSVAARADDLLLKDKFAEAEALYKTLVSGLEELLGADHREVAIALHKLAAAKSGQGQNDEAKALAQRATTILTATEESECRNEGVAK